MKDYYTPIWVRVPKGTHWTESTMTETMNREIASGQQIRNKILTGGIMETKQIALLAWCEECGEPIYQGQKHTEQVSDNGNRYFYCAGCTVKPNTPDERREEN